LGKGKDGRERGRMVGKGEGGEGKRNIGNYRREKGR